MPRKVVSCHCGKIIKSELNLAGFVGLDQTGSKKGLLCESEAPDGGFRL